MDPLPTDERKPEPRRHAILLVEGDFLTRWGAAEYLRETGFAVIEAVSAQEALAAIRAGSTIDVIFCSVEATSGPAGGDFLHYLEAQRPSLAVLLASEDLGKGGILAPMPTRATVGKPYVMSDVEVRLKALIAAG